MMKLCTGVLLGGLVLFSADAKSIRNSKLNNNDLSLLKEQLKKELIAELKSEGYSISKSIGKEESIREEQGSYRVTEAETASEEKKDWDEAKKQGKAGSSVAIKKGFIPIPGTESYIRPYGFANIKCALTRHQNASGYASDLSVFPANVAHDDEGRRKKNDYNFLASDSRIGLETFSIAKFDGKEYPLKTLFECDFSGGDDNSTTITNKYKLKVRHVYMTLGNFLAGLTTSTFIDPAAAAEINGPGVTGSSTKRVPQLRYVVNYNNVEVRYALERVLTAYHYTKTTDSGDVVLRKKDSYSPKNSKKDDNKYHSSDILPAAVVAIKVKNENSHFGVAGVLRYLKVTNNTYYNADKTVFRPSRTEKGLGFGARLSGSYKFANKDSIFGSFTFGNGIGLFLADAEKSSVYMRGSGEFLEMELNDAYGAVLGYRHFWTEKYNTRSTLVFGFTHLCNSKKLLRDLSKSVSFPEVNKNLFTANLNLLFDITNKFTCGFEFCHSMRKLTDGRKGTAQILMFTSSISF